MWYNNAGNINNPVVVEFSYTIDNDNPSLLDTGRQRFAQALPALEKLTGWVDPGSKFKPAYVYSLDPMA